MQFTHQGFGPFLAWMTLGVLCIFPILAAIVIYKLGGLPGAIARSRKHPQAAAINICGWMGLVTLVLWPVAMVWAHLRPAGSVGAGLPEDTASLKARINALSQRFTGVEEKLKIDSGAQP